MNRTRWFSRVALPLLLASTSARASENRTLIMGLWPNELRLIDEETEEAVGEIRLRYGAVTGYGRTPHTPDYRRLYYITDRMEAVEVVDPKARQVVDELRLSTAGRRVRILNVYPHPGGTELILRVSAVGIEIDRFEAEDAEFVVYDLNRHQVKASFRLPPEVRTDFVSPIPFSSDGKSFFAFGRDVYELSYETHELISTIPLGTPREAGYGGLRRTDLYATAPGVFYTVASTTDPFLKKTMTGVLRIDLGARSVWNVEIGPRIDADVVAISRDGKTGYAGVKDLAKIDMATGRVLSLKKGFLQGRAATVLILSADETKLFVTGIGNSLQVVDAETLEVKRAIPLERDLMANPLPIP